MKKMRFFAILAAGLTLALSFASCNKDDKKSSEQEGTSTASVSAFFPTGYNRGDVAAWYASKEVQQDGQVNVIAVYVFKNSDMLATLYKKKSDGTEQRAIEASGTCQMVSGDYTNGTAKINIPDFGEEMDITIVNGTFTARGATFTKQDNANIPAAQAATGNGGSQNGNLMDKAEAYLPMSYAQKTIAAWYTSIDESVDRVKIEAVFLFNDNALLVTKSKVYSEADGREPSKEIEVEGTYQLTSGDYTNGAARATVDNSTFDVVVIDGVLTASGTRYHKQDNADAPAPTK